MKLKRILLALMAATAMALVSADGPGSVHPASAQSVDSESRSSGLFYEVDGDSPPSIGVDTLDSRLVGIDLGQLSEVTKSHLSPKGPVTGQPPTPRKLILNLFNDAVFTGIVEHVEPTAAGHALWGKLDGVELGTMTMVANGKVVVGTVRTPNEVYSIRTAGDGTYVIRQIDESSLPPPGEPLEGPLSLRDPHSFGEPLGDSILPRNDGTEADNSPLDDGSEIDVMVVYTPLAKHREGGRAAIEALIDLFVAETNQAYANSGVIHRIRLVLKEEVDYVEDGNSGIDLGRLRSDSDGYMDHVHERRDLYAADFVHFVVGKSDVGGGAIYEGAFAMTASYRTDLVFAHELGHNMGLAHDRYVEAPAGRGAHFGYVNQRMFDEGAPRSARWRTIMAYPSQCSDVGGFSCPKVQYFSNPENTYRGDPMGVSSDNPSTGVDGPSDAVRTLNDRREFNANRRRSLTSPTPRVALTLSQYWLSENGGVSSVKATLHRPSSADTVITVSASPEDAITLSVNTTLTIPAGQTVSDDTVMIAGVNNNNQTGDVTVTVSATATNTSDLGVVPPEPVVLAVVDDETTPVVTLSLSPAEVFEDEDWTERRTLLTASLDNRSNAETTVRVSASPSKAVEEIHRDTLTIPAGQLVNEGLMWLIAVDDTEFTKAEKMVTVSGIATNSLGVTGPQSVTLTVIDDDAPTFADDSIAFTFTEGIAGYRYLPEAEFGNEPLTYSISPALSNGVTFDPGPLARIGVTSMAVASAETSYTLTATDSDGDTDTMTVNIAVREGVCPNSAAISGSSDPEIVRDCEALLISMHVLGGEQLLKWGKDLSMDDWQGVAIADSRAVGIDLSDLGLNGTIPGELGGLSELQSLKLNSNKLKGPIPAELGKLSNLRELTAYDNQLTGEIPKELGNLASLQSLSFNGNELTDAIPTELGDLNSLTRLDLAANKLKGGIPVELGRLSNLQILYLPLNQLTGPIPTEIGDLGKLEYLDVNNNMLDGEIPHELGNLANLEVLNFDGNRLMGTIPLELGNLSNLYALSLALNQLSGEIPKELADLSNLTTLFIYNDGITGCIPEELRDVETNDLDNLGLPFCDDEVEQSACVTGTAVPDATNTGLISDCEVLLALHDTLADHPATLNWASDTPITDWDGITVRGTPARVAWLDLRDWGLGGSLPAELGRLSGLTYLNLRNNGLSGPIPTELGDLTNLRYLGLNNNELTGPIPDLRNLTNLEQLYLSNNDLSGTLPDWLGSLTKVREFWLWGNEMSGPIPDLSGMTGLVRLKLQSNELTGGIPTSFGDMKDLVYLYLHDNALTGDIPSELGDMDSLRYLWLHTNELEGRIPPELGSLSNLWDLNLHGNNLTGGIPSELGDLSNLTHLRLHRNMLSGAIPNTLGDLGRLRFMWLHGNMLSGQIPAELGSLTNLERLWLSENNLSGPIPTELGGLSSHSLVQWRLSDNQLSGCVPPGLTAIEDSDFASLGLEVCEDS